MLGTTDQDDCEAMQFRFIIRRWRRARLELRLSVFVTFLAKVIAVYHYNIIDKTHNITKEEKLLIHLFISKRENVAF